jgi:capsular polysaccharide biosynthesis protein
VTLSLNKGSNRPDWLWAPEYADVDDQPADLSTGLTSLGFIRGAIYRSAKFCVAMAAAGLVIGSALYLSSPPSDQASTTMFLTVGPEAAPGTAIQDDQAIAQSRVVAGLALHQLGLQQSVNSFLGSYTATALTDRVLEITVNAPSSADAVSRANALAAQFLRYRANQLEIQQRLLTKSLDQQVVLARQHVSSLTRQISQLAGGPAASADKARLSSLRTQRTLATATLATLQQSVNGEEATSQEVTTSQVRQSQVLDPAAPLAPPSRLKHLVLYGFTGLLVGLMLALGIVIIRALISDRLRRRDDIARALGAPVKLSVGHVGLSRWRPGRRGLAAAARPEIQRIAGYLAGVIAADSRGPTALAIVPMDEPQVAALSLVSLAISSARDGRHVVVADLTQDAGAARLLGVNEAGVVNVNVEDVRLAIATPEDGDAVPVGPLHRASSALPRPARNLAAACASADLLLTLVALDPSLGAEHLATWATDAVVLVTAGRSSWTRIQAVGEMIRLAGTRLVAGVLVGADKKDESLGVTHFGRADYGGGDSENGARSSPGRQFLATADRGFDEGEANPRGRGHGGGS